ncbi:MAG: S-layer homology domain-containing protein, partial [Clostridiales Family XIII bacterium]|nr:S-layer homology domain-containing protein [Clostridiales Family XIII bacterium]
DAAAGAGVADVAQGSPLSAAVSWAYGAGVVNGMGDGSFAPDGGITREQIAAMLHRYARHRGADLSESGDLSAFADAGAISAWAVEALAWANGAGLINGMGDGTLAPQGGATRAQAATMLMNWGL